VQSADEMHKNYIFIKQLSFSFACHFLAKRKNMKLEKDALRVIEESDDDILNQKFIELVQKIDSDAIDPDSNTIKYVSGNILDLGVTGPFEFDFETFCIMLANLFSNPCKYGCSNDQRNDAYMNWLIGDCGAKLIQILCFIDIVKADDFLLIPKFKVTKSIYPKEIIDSGLVNLNPTIKDLILKKLGDYRTTQERIQTALKKLTPDANDQSPDVNDQLQSPDVNDQPIDENQNKKLRYWGTAIFIFVFLGSSFAVLGENISYIFSNCHFPILNHSAYLAWSILFGIISASSIIIAAIRILSTDKFQRGLCNSDTRRMKFLALILVGHNNLQEEHKKPLEIT
jgi:hypothetical protein